MDGRIVPRISGLRIENDTKAHFFATPNDPAVPEWYSVPIEGGSPVQLSQPMVLGDFIQQAWEDRVTGRSVYTFVANGGAVGLFSVLPDGTGRVQLNTDQGGGPIVQTVYPSPSGDRVVYVAPDAVGDVAMVLVKSDGTGESLPRTTPFSGSSFVETMWARDSSAFLWTGQDGSTRSAEVETIAGTQTFPFLTYDDAMFEGTNFGWWE